MNDADESSGSNHRKSGARARSSKNTGVAGIKEEARRGLEIVDTIVNHVVQVKWILKGVLDDLEETVSKPAKCRSCNGRDHTVNRKKESTSQDKKGKKSKKVVLPAVSGNTVQHPNENLLGVYDQGLEDQEPEPGRSSRSRAGGPGAGRGSSSLKRGKNIRDVEEEKGGKKRRSAKKSRSRGRSSVVSRKSKKTVTSSSLASCSGSSTSRSSSSSASAPAKKKPPHQDNELLSIGVSGLEEGNKWKDPKPSTPGKQTKPTVLNADGSKTSPVHPHSLASSKLLTNDQNIQVQNHEPEAERKQKSDSEASENETEKPNTMTRAEVLRAQLREKFQKFKMQKMSGSGDVDIPSTPPDSTASTSDAEASKTEKEKPSPTASAEELRAKLREKFQKFKMQKMSQGSGGNSSSTLPDLPASESGAEASKKEKEKPNRMASAEELRAKSREKFQKFKMERMSQGSWGSSSISSSTLVDLTTNVSSADANAQAQKPDAKAEHNELPANKTEPDKVKVKDGGKTSANDMSELLEMKRDQWTLMRNSRTGVDSIKEEVQRGIRKTVGDVDNFTLYKNDITDEYLVGNYYFVTKAGQPLQLMRYVGEPMDDLPHDAFEEGRGAPSGFVPLDISSLSKSQFSVLQELGSNWGSRDSDISHTTTVEMVTSDSDDCD